MTAVEADRRGGDRVDVLDEDEVEGSETLREEESVCNGDAEEELDDEVEAATAASSRPRRHREVVATLDAARKSISMGIWSRM